MPEDPDGREDTPTPDRDPDRVEDAPTVSCTRCGEAWDLAFELEELRAGNQALEQFALDHERHTGHFPDDVTPWLVDCRRCPDGEAYLGERAARRWAMTHARHTGHAVEVVSPDGEAPPELVESP